MKSASSFRFAPSAPLGRKLARPPPISTSGSAAKYCSTMRSYSPRRRTWATMAAGVALGIGHDADRHPEPALGQAGDSLDLRIIQRIERAIGVHAHGVDRGLMTSGIGAGGV